MPRKRRRDRHRRRRRVVRARRASPWSSGSSASTTPPAARRGALRRSAAGCSSPRAAHGEPVVKPVVHTITWWQNGGIKFGVGTQIDGLAVMMLFVVTLISLLVHIYSTAYMHGDVRFTHYYAMLSLFTASMLHARRRRQHAACCSSAGSSSASARSC